MRPRTCPHCLAILGLDEGFRIDSDYNMICLSCGQIAVPTTWQKEQEVDASIRARQPATTAGYWNDKYNQQYQQQQRQQHLQQQQGTKTYPPSMGPQQRAYPHSTVHDYMD